MYIQQILYIQSSNHNTKQTKTKKTQKKHTHTKQNKTSNKQAHTIWMYRSFSRNIQQIQQKKLSSSQRSMTPLKIYITLMIVLYRKISTSKSDFIDLK